MPGQHVPDGDGDEQRRALDAIHARLLQTPGDAIASSQLAFLVLQPLVRALRQRLGHRLEAAGMTVRDDALNDAAGDAYMSYVTRPEQYDPQRAPGGLFSYLLMSACGDLLNALPRIEKHRHVAPLSLVELPADGRNTGIALVGAGTASAGTDRDGAHAEPPEDPVDEQMMETKLALLQSEPERKVLRHLEAGEHRTAVFAEDLGIASLPLSEQRQEVKRAKDMIKKRLERAGFTWH